jgi:hypothetical protein
MPVDRRKVQYRIKELLGLRTHTSRSELDDEAGGYDGKASSLLFLKSGHPPISLIVYRNYFPDILLPPTLPSGMLVWVFHLDPTTEPTLLC